MYYLDVDFKGFYFEKIYIFTYKMLFIECYFISNASMRICFFFK